MTCIVQLLYNLSRTPEESTWKHKIPCHYGLWEQKVMNLEVTNDSIQKVSFSEAVLQSAGEGSLSLLLLILPLASWSPWKMRGLISLSQYTPGEPEARCLWQSLCLGPQAQKPPVYLCRQGLLTRHRGHPCPGRGSPFASYGILSMDSGTVPWYFHTVLKGREAQGTAD